jgi:2-dehydropantoate 2-reductase
VAMLKINIIGSGAMGSFIACRLVHSGVNVNLISCHRSKKDIEELSRLGFNILNLKTNEMEYPSNVFPHLMSIKYTDNIPPCDVLILCSKANQIQNLLPQIDFDFIAVITLMNGYNYHSSMYQQFPEKPLYAGSVHIGATFKSRNIIEHEGGNIIHIAPYANVEPPDRSIIQKVLSIFNATGIETKLKDDHKKMLLKKLYINSIINPLTAIWNIPKGELLKTKERRDLIHKLMNEILLVLSSEKINWDRAYAERLMRLAIENTPNRSSSMHVDLLANRETEIDFINGALLKIARKNGIEMPVNKSIIEKIHNFSH